MANKTVLVIDDDPDMNDIYQKILTGKYNVLVSADTADARKKLAKHKVDLIVLDLMLPNESGVEFLSVLKKDPKYKDVQILIASIFVGMLEKAKGLYPDVTSISKPFERENFLGEVESKLGEMK